MLITAFLFYFVFVQSIEGAVELSISGNLLRVKSSSGEWYPLCSNSVNQKYGNIACSTQSNQQLSSYSFVLLNQTTYSIACTSNLCFSFLSSYCKTGVLVNCIPKNNLCSDTSVQIGKKCVRVSRVLVDGYFDAQEACNPSSLIGNIKPNDIQQISNSFGNNTVLITSGVRRGSKWQWGSGDKIEIPIIGNDRCLAIIENKLQSIDCEAKGFAMCEMGRECISSGNEYSGELAKASNGKKCLKWNDPSILFGQKISNLWSHNYCRFVNQNGTQSRKPMCYTSYQNIDECSIPQCPEQFNDPLNNNKKCSWDMFSCDNNTKCISNKFKCDYDIDCNDGTDELDCEDYLQPFELIGAYRLADNIIEVWTYIPHVQGCARKCQESLLICEAFSYEPKTQTCLLSDTSHSYTSLVQKITSLYYRRRFSSKDVEFQLINNTLIATKQTIRAPVCDENFSSDKIGSICRVLGFGDSMPIPQKSSMVPSTDKSAVGMSAPVEDGDAVAMEAVALLRSSTSQSHFSDDYDDADEGNGDNDNTGSGAVRSFDNSGTFVIDSPSVVRKMSGKSDPKGVRRQSPSHFSNAISHPPQLAWKLSCLRQPNCTQTHQSTCHHIRCSTCSEAACSDGQCVSFSKLCDGHLNCRTGDDEAECTAKSFRLSNGTDTSGYVEVLFRSNWEPVCGDSIKLSEVDTICDAMRIGETGEVLPSFREIPRSWKVECSVDCSIRRHSFCRRQARISCVSKQETHLNSECGTRRIEVNAKDAKIARYARVVGGFETVPGAFPWTAAIRIKVGKIHHCGASILDHTHLITAAHCFEDDQRPSAYDVVVGDWDNNSTDGTEQVYNVMRIHFYPLYKDIFAHDIAIIELNRPGIRYTDYAVPICLPSREFVYTPGRQCVVSGWGSMGLQYAQRLQAALIPIINRFECVNSSEIYQSMSRSAFCAGYLDGGIDSCQGDSGGPFACRRQDGSFVLAGVISWGDGCAQKKQPGIYTMVAPYLSWINSILNDY